MYITNHQTQGTQVHPMKTTAIQSPTKIMSTHCSIRLPLLQQFISNNYNGCSLPPLDQLLQIDLDNEDIRLALQNYSGIKLQELEAKGCEQQYIYYVYSGKVNLKKYSDSAFEEEDPQEELEALRRTIISKPQMLTLMRKKNSRTDATKLLEIKENTFFALNTFKKNSTGVGPMEIQKMKIHSTESGQYDKCLLGKIRINPKYGSEWYLSESIKYQFISSLVNGDSGDISEHKLKGLSRFFKVQKFRRGTSLIREDEINEKLFFLFSGEVQYTKNFHYFPDAKSHPIIKTIKIANANERAVFGSQFLLNDFFGASKSVNVTAKALQNTYAQSEDTDGTNTNKNIRMKVSTLNQSNFTVTVLSAFAEVYFITLTKFKELCQKYVQEVPQTLRKNIENGYVTILRNLKEKMDLEIIKINRNQKQRNEKRVLFEAKVQFGQFQHKRHQDREQYQEHVFSKQNQLGRTSFQKGYQSAIQHPAVTSHRFHQTSNSLLSTPSPAKNLANSPQKVANFKRSSLIETNLHGDYVQKTKAKRLDKKIEMLMVKNKKDVDFKKKIEKLMMGKFAQSRNNRMQNNSSPILMISQKQPSVGEKDQEHFEQQNKKQIERSPVAIAKDLQQIFMNKDEEARTLSIQRQNDILNRKQKLLKKRYSSTQNILIVHQQNFDKNRNKLYRMDLIRKGALDLDKDLRDNLRQASQKKPLNIGQYSHKIKQNCIQKINKANKIKEQFMTIKSQCQHCHCYDNIDGIYQSTVQKDMKYQTMKTGSAWRLSESRNSLAEEPLEKLHSRNKFLSEKSASRYEHNKHLVSKRKGKISTSHRRLSAPVI